MSNPDHIQKLITTKQRRLQILREQATRLGVNYAPPHMLIEIKDLETDIAELYRQAGLTPPPPVPLPLSASPASAPAATKSQPAVYAIVGLLVGGAVNVAFNLLAAAIQQRYFAEQFSNQALWGLAIFAVGGLLLGLWLSGPVAVPTSAQPLPAGPTTQPTITRLKALFSYSKLRGQGISLNDILLIGSKLDIDTRDNDGTSHH